VSGAGGYLAGRGIADITGEAADCGMLGYGKSFQRTRGLHMRLRSRAFVFQHEASGQRVLLSINDLPMIFQSVHGAVLSRLSGKYGSAYTEQNVLITATHTHCGPGGYSHHLLYNSNTGGFRPLTFAAIVDGIVEAAVRAHEDLAPTELLLGHGELYGASSNRSRAAFDRNPAADRAFFPNGVDPQTTVLAMKRDGDVVGVVNWFATHCTSMTNRNFLISADNKGYAAYHWERLNERIDYLAGTTPSFISAFAQTNAGDMSPNLNHRPGSGPTEDQFENTRIIGERQYEAAATALKEAVGVAGPVDSRITYLDLAGYEVSAAFTGDGRSHRTGSGCGGAASLAGTDEGPGFRGFRQGRNPLWDGLSRSVWYRLFPKLREAQAPKGVVVPGGLLNRLVPLAQQRVPVQLVRIGSLYLLTIPGEATIVAGLRLRRTVASVLDVPVTEVLVAGYSNAYIHYITTPEEYESQRYEGGSTLFGRWELGAFQQTAARLAEAMQDDVPMDRGDPPPTTRRPRAARTPGRADEAPPGRYLGDVLIGPRSSYRPGQQVRVVVAGANPNNDLRRGSTHFCVERFHHGDWMRIADDGDWSTRFHWARQGLAVSEITITWDIEHDTPPGRYRIRYFGAARPPAGEVRLFETRTEPFDVTTAPSLA
jgi:neutral ceramidase